MPGGFALILLFLVAGEALSIAAASALSFSMPGNVIGMLLLTAALALGLVKRRWIEKAAAFLLDHMAFFFVPAGVGLMAHTEVFAEHWPVVSFSVIASFAVVLISTGILQKALSRRKSEPQGKEK